MTEIKVPGFPESVTDGTIVAWHKKPGDAVRREENLVDIETDKVMFEVPAPVDGTLEEVFEQEGATVVSGQLLARITDGAVTALGPAPAPADGARQEAAVAASPGAIVTPAAERMIAERGLDSRAIAGTGRGGRVLKEDVLRHLGAGAEPAGAAAAEVAEAGAQEAAAPQPAERRPVVEFPGSGRPEKRVPMSRLRARVAERLVEAQHTAAILSTFNEINMQPVNEIRHRYRERFEQEHGIKLGYMSFFIKAAVEGLKRFPVINASIDGQEIIYHGYFDIGIAVASPRGLVVPILRDADQLDMAQLEQQIAAYAGKARNGSLSLDEISGGTFTITNGGVFGSLLSTPILNPPQSAILGMHKIQDRAVVENGQIVVRPMMYVALSYDHRLIDGSEAVQFLVAVKEFLEDPARMLLAV